MYIKMNKQAMPGMQVYTSTKNMYIIYHRHLNKMALSWH